MVVFCDNKFDTEDIYFRSFHLNLWYDIDNIPKIKQIRNLKYNFEQIAMLTTFVINIIYGEGRIYVCRNIEICVCN